MTSRAERWLRDRVSATVPVISEGVRLRFLPDTVGFSLAELPPPIDAPDTPIRLLIAPANYARQGYAWARSAELLPGVGARNLELVRSSVFDFPHDFAVPEHIATWSATWARQQRRAVRRYTHVLVEAARPILGRAFGGDIVREHAALTASGLSVAYVSHGSDLRLPSRHAAKDRHSPFRDDDWDLQPLLEEQAARNAAALRHTGGRIFVPTPELLLDVPEASWLPIVVDPDAWRADRPALDGSGVPTVLHVPTNPRIKGSDLIDPAVSRLAAEGIIDYQRAQNVSSEEMRRRVLSADIVLEQFRLGIYATTAIEAMAAGRLVVGHVADHVRAHVRDATGRELPIVEATVDTLESVLRSIAERPDLYVATALAGRDFAYAVHDGRFSADVLGEFLLSGR